VSLDFSKLVRELRRQKQKYHAKVLSDGAIYANWLRSLDEQGIMPWYVWLIIPEFTYSGIAFSLLFDIPPSEIVPVNWDFSVDLPDLDELMQGILAEINSFDWSKIYEFLQDLEKLIKETIEEEFQESVEKSRPRKAVYGKTRYGRSYFDPPAVREAIRSTMFKLWVERMTLEQLRRDFDSMKNSLGLGDGFTQLLFNKISQVIYAQPSAMILGYGVLGRSFLGEPARLEPVREARLKMIDYFLELVEWLGNTLDHAKIGLVLGLVPLGYGFLLPPRSILKKPLPPKKLQPLTDYVRSRGSALIEKFTWNAFTFANYNKPEERTDYRRSERADQYMSLQAIRYQIEQIVDPIIRKHTNNPVLIRMYKSAALNLVALPAKRHRWGYEAFKAMSEDELYRYWIQHWSSQGLNREVLNEIYERLKRWLPEWRRTKLLLGQRIKQTRYLLSRLLKHRYQPQA